MEQLSKFRDYLIKNFKHVNAGRSPVFIIISLVVGGILVIVGLALELKTTAGRICTGIGALSVIANAMQIFHKKAI